MKLRLRPVTYNISYWKIVLIILIGLIIIKVLFMFTFLRFASLKCGLTPFRSGLCFKANRSHTCKFLLNEPNLCGGEVFLLIAVTSKTGDFSQRQTIRETWGSVASRHSNIRLAFILGRSMRETEFISIKKESMKYHDIIQKDFFDSYKNLSIKSEAILDFTRRFCPNANFVLKTDNDMFINVPLLVKKLKNIGLSELAIIGHQFFRHKRENVAKTSKWYTNSSVYPLEYYPEFVSGTAYVIPGIFASSLFQMSLSTKLLELEDVYITGILRERLGLPIRHLPGFSLYRCSLKSCDILNMHSCHQQSNEGLYKLWELREACST